jgi:hypothetical protein
MIFLLVFGEISLAPCATFDIVKPSSDVAYSEKSDPTKNYEKRKGHIEFSSNILYPQTQMKVNDTLKITFFNDTQYEVIIESIVYNQNNTISISGKIKNTEFSTFLLTLNSEGFIITLKDLKQNYEYHAIGSVSNQIGAVTEIDVSKTPPKIYLPPKPINN